MDDLLELLDQLKMMPQSKKGFTTTTQVVNGEEVEVRVFKETRARPKTYMRIRGKQTSDLKLLSKKGDQ